MNAAVILLLVLKASVMLIVFAIGLKANFSDVTCLFRRPAQLFRALLSMNVLMPLIALGLVEGFDLHPAVQIALIAIAVSPIPPVLPNKALKAGGQENYTIGLLVAAAVISVVVIPLAMEVFEKITSLPLSMRPRAVASTVLTMILIPLLMGIAVRRLAQTFADRAARLIGLIATVLLALCAIPVLIGEGRPMYSLIGDGTLASLGAFTLLGLVAGHLLGGPDAENRPVLAIASASRHPAIALGIAHANFPEQKLALPAVFLYLIVSAILSAIYLKWVKRGRRKSAPVEKTVEV
ncbi:MAG TPA: hypothetical protein VL866_06200 [Pyrinomonadaceae bacterium]|nr:hypothetical protein [Pyrinomonadaceae bacterium]